LACRPFAPKKKIPFFAPSAPVARSRKPPGAVALGAPEAQSCAEHPPAEIPAVQYAGNGAAQGRRSK